MVKRQRVAIHETCNALIALIVLVERLASQDLDEIPEILHAKNALRRIGRDIPRVAVHRHRSPDELRRLTLDDFIADHDRQNHARRKEPCHG
jgi:ABC-type molybdate transport system ATPase subunit